jgi:hypothetical protein
MALLVSSVLLWLTTIVSLPRLSTSRSRSVMQTNRIRARQSFLTGDSDGVSANCPYRH